MRRSITVAAVALFVACSVFAQAQGIYTPPPRTVEDILAVLDQYKPDPKAAQQAQADAQRQPPVTENRTELQSFYFERSRAAEKIGLVRQQIDDLRKALEYTPHERMTTRAGDQLTINVLSGLAFAESVIGNYLNALKLRERLLGQLPSGGRTGDNMRVRTQFAIANANLGDLASAREFLAQADSAYSSLRFNQNWGSSGHTLRLPHQRWLESTAMDCSRWTKSSA